MKIYVQWTQAEAGDWLEMDSHAWAAQARKPVPQGGEMIDDSEGWIYALNVQGVTFEAFDHYAIEPIPGNGCRVTVWQDDPEDFAPEEMFAQVWEFLPPAPDERLGGRMNTRQSLTIYAGNPSRYSQSDIMAEPAKPLDEFVPPHEHARHGITVPEKQVQAHRAVRSPHGWREWIDG